MDMFTIIGTVLLAIATITICYTKPLVLKLMAAFIWIIGLVFPLLPIMVINEGFNFTAIGVSVVYAIVITIVTVALFECWRRHVTQTQDKPEQ